LGAARQWRPNPGPQTSFLACSAFEVGYGGAAGGGKSEALLVGATRLLHLSDYKAILFRRTFPELEGSLIERSHFYYAGLPGARYNEQKKVWSFASGAKIVFAHLQHESDVTAHLSKEYQYIAFDECSTFTERQYRFLISRLRSSTGVPTRLRWGSNPPEDDDNHFLIRRFAPWIDTRDTYKGPRARPGETLWFAVDDDTGDERVVPKGTPGALSRTFFPARLVDNPVLMAADPAYASRIKQMGAVESARYLHGDWFAKRVEGALWQREDFDLFRVDRMPENLVRVAVAVDPAVTNKDSSDEHGLIVGGIDSAGHVYVWEDLSGKGSPEWWAKVAAAAYHRNFAHTLVGEVNNGGDLVRSNVANTDPTVFFEEVRATRGKEKRAEPVATLTKRGRVHIVGALPQLESECRRWVPGKSTWSPNRLDAFVWLVSHLVPQGSWDALPLAPKPSDDWTEAVERRLQAESNGDEWGKW
jgi:hypothetical protein